MKVIGVSPRAAFPLLPAEFNFPRLLPVVRVLTLLALLVACSETAKAQLVTVSQTNNVAGSYTWLCPPAITSVQVECWGAGGGGGGAFGTGHADAGGGAGGAYARTNVYAVTPGVTYYFQVGAGGAGGPGASSSPGVAGGDSWFSNNTAVVVLAKGGSGGNGAPAGGTGTGGIAPAASSSIGASAAYAGGNGGNGGPGSGTFTAGGAGGSSAGTAAPGNNGANYSTTTTAAPDGGGTGGASAASGPGLGGGSPGGGGGGGGNSATSARKGGNGADGQVIITYSSYFETWIGDGGNNNWTTNTPNICWDTAGDGNADSNFTNNNSVLFGPSGSGNPTVNLVSRVAPSSATVGSVSDYTFTGSGWISGAASLTQSGPGNLTIYNTANDYFGGTTITGGEILLGNDNVLGTGLVMLNGGGLSSDGMTARTLTNTVLITTTTGITLGDVANTGKLTFTAPVDFSGSSRSLTNNSDVVFAGGATDGVISQKNGPGTLTINGLVNFSGSSDVYQGTMIYDNATITNANRIIPDATIGNTARLVITNGTTMTITGAPNNLRAGRAGDPSGMNYVDLAGLLSLPGADANDGFVQPWGGCAYAQVTFWPGGDFTARGVTNYQGVGNTVFNFNGGILRALVSNPHFFEGISQAFVQAGGANIDDRGFAITIYQPLLDGGGGGGLNKIGAGTLALMGANSYTGNTVVSNGTLVVTTGTTLGGGVVVKDGATFAITNQNSTLNLSSLTMGVAGASTLQFNFPGGNPGSATISSGALTGNGNVTINIAGTGFSVGSIVLIQSANPIAGLASFHLGSLPPGIIATLATTANTVSLNITSAASVKNLLWTGASNGQWDTAALNWDDLDNGNNPTNYAQLLGVGDEVAFDDSGANTSINVSLPVTPFAMTFSNNTAAYVLGGSGIGGAGSLVLAGTGTVTLSQSNSFSGGTTLNAGEIFVGNDSALGSGPVNLNGGTLSSDGATGRTLANAILVTSNAIFGDATHSGAITNTGIMNLNGSASIQAVTVNNSVTVLAGGTTNGSIAPKLGYGTLILQGTNTMPNAINVNQGTFVLDGILTNNGTLRIQGANDYDTVTGIITTNGYLVLSTLAPNLRLGANGTNGSALATNILDISGYVRVFASSSGNGNFYIGGKNTNAYQGIAYIRTGADVQFSSIQRDGATGYGEFDFDGGILRAQIATPGFVTNLNVCKILSHGAIIDSAGLNIGIPQAMLDGGGGGGLTKIGDGQLQLTATNTYTGTTLVSQGSLGGTGVISGPVIVAAGATLVPDIGAGIGTLTISSNLTLSNSCAVSMLLDKEVGTTNSDLVAGLNNVTYGGTLIVSNLGPVALTNGDTFQLFSATGSKTGNFSSIVILPATGATNGTFNPATGQLTINSGATIPLTPTNLTVQVTGGNISLSWPGNYLGWSLQVQTNSLSTGLKTNWVTIPGSSSVTSTNFPIGATNGAVFYRMYYQP